MQERLERLRGRHFDRDLTLPTSLTQLSFERKHLTVLLHLHSRLKTKNIDHVDS